MPSPDSDSEEARTIAPGASLDPVLRDLVLSFGLAWNRGEVDKMLDLAHPEFEFSPELDKSGRPLFPGLKPVYRGRQAIRDHLEEWSSMFEGGVTVELVGVAYGSGCMAILTRVLAEGREGLSTERSISSAVEVSDGLVSSWRNHADWEDALTALGLPTDLRPGPP